MCKHIIAVIAIIATKFHQVLRCKQSEVDLVMKAAKTRRKNPCGNTTSGVAKKTQSVFFFFLRKVIFIKCDFWNLKK